MIFSSFALLANTPKPGYIQRQNGEIIKGYVAYLKIAVPTRVIFYRPDSSSGTYLKSSKTLFSPNELKSFCYGAYEKWVAVHFTKAEIGFKASYFLQVLDSAQGFYLLGGLVTGEGCNCSGTKFSSSYYYVLSNMVRHQKLIIAKKKRSKITYPANVAQFYQKFDLEFSRKLFVKPKDVLLPLKQ
ncbi:MAG: hypothetical protein ACPGLV_03320 [Bacteroidia bacterium]